MSAISIRRSMAAVATLVGIGVCLPAVASGAARASISPRHCSTLSNDGGDWPVAGHDLANTRVQNAETTLGPTQVASLAPAWTFDVNAQAARIDLPSLEATPIVAAGCVFVATKEGEIDAINADTGHAVWCRHIDPGGLLAADTEQSSSCGNPGAGPAGAGIGGWFVGAPTYDGGVLYLLVNRLDTPYAIALDPATGAIRWTSDSLPTHQQVLHGSYYTNATPVVAGGVLIAGFSPQEGDPHGEGGFVLLDTSSGALLTRTFTIPRRAWAQGYAGGGIWTTPAVDTASGYSYIGSGNPFSKQTQDPHTDAILKVDVQRGRPTFGEVVRYYSGNIDQETEAAKTLTRPTCSVEPDPGRPPTQVGPVPVPPPFDDLQQFDDSPTCGQMDLDFGAGPNLIATPAGLYVGDLQKSGYYHLVNADTMAGVRQTPLGFGCLLCNGSTPAFDAGHVTASVSTSMTAHFDPFGPLPGPGFWESPRSDGFIHYQPVSIADGVVYTLDSNGTMTVVDEGTGHPLLEPRQLGLDAGQDAFTGISSSGIAIARHTVFVAAGHHLIAYRAAAAA